MNRLIKALAKKLSRPKAPVAADQPCNAVSAENVLMPDIYVDRNVAAVPDLEILDLSKPDIDKSAGFDPYDTAVLRKKLGPKPR
jgi:hypothetical protein